MKAAKIMAACLSICAVLCACAAAAAWIPVAHTIFSAGVTAGEWKADGGAAKELSFSANTDMAGYAGLAQPSVAYSEEDADSPVPCDRMTAFDDDADMSYFFAGWYTEPEGGERVTTYGDLFSLGDPPSVLYARWGTKTALNVELDDQSFAVYDISFTLGADGNEYSLTTSQQQTLTAVYYLSPGARWNIAIKAGLKSVSYSSADVILKEGGAYSLLVKVINRVTEIGEIEEL